MPGAPRIKTTFLDSFAKIYAQHAPIFSNARQYFQQAVSNLYQRLYCTRDTPALSALEHDARLKLYLCRVISDIASGRLTMLAFLPPDPFLSCVQKPTASPAAAADAEGTMMELAVCEQCHSIMVQPIRVEPCGHIVCRYCLEATYSAVDGEGKGNRVSRIPQTPTTLTHSPFPLTLHKMATQMALSMTSSFSSDALDVALAAEQEESRRQSQPQHVLLCPCCSKKAKCLTVLPKIQTYIYNAVIFSCPYKNFGCTHCDKVPALLEHVSACPVALREEARNNAAMRQKLVAAREKIADLTVELGDQVVINTELQDRLGVDDSLLQDICTFINTAFTALGEPAPIDMLASFAGSPRLDGDLSSPRAAGSPTGPPAGAFSPTAAGPAAASGVASPRTQASESAFARIRGHLEALARLLEAKYQTSATMETAVTELRRANTDLLQSVDRAVAERLQACTKSATLEETLRSMKQTAADLETEFAAATLLRDEQDRTITRLENENADLRARLAGLQDRQDHQVQQDGPCALCAETQAANADLVGRTRELAAELAQRSSDLLAKAGAVATLQQANESLSDRIVDLDREVRELMGNIARYQDLVSRQGSSINVLRTHLQPHSPFGTGVSSLAGSIVGAEPLASFRAVPLEVDVTAVTLLRYIFHPQGIPGRTRLDHLANECRMRLYAAFRGGDVDTEERFKSLAELVALLRGFYCSSFPVDEQLEFLGRYDVEPSSPGSARGHPQPQDQFGIKVHGELLTAYRRLREENTKLESILSMTTLGGSSLTPRASALIREHVSTRDSMVRSFADDEAATPLVGDAEAGLSV